MRVASASTASGLTVSGNNLGTGVFFAYAGTITIQDLTIRDGLALGGNGAATFGPGGGGGAGLGGGLLVNNVASVTAQNVTFDNMLARGGNGGAGNGAAGGNGGGGMGGAGGGGGPNATGGGGGATNPPLFSCCSRSSERKISCSPAGAHRPEASS